MRAGDPEDRGPDAPDDAAAPSAVPQTPPEAEPAPAAPGAPEAGDADRIAALERDLKEAQDGRLRIAADFDNYRKRARRDAEDAARRAREEALAAMLAVADNFDRALDHAEETNAAAVVEGVRLVQRQLLAALERFDVRPFDSVGSAFNPEEHDAVGQLETLEVPAGSIAREMARGYRIGARVLRPAMVVVARPPAAVPPSDGGGDAETEAAPEEAPQ
jgi:molecular chaperone GrpE